LIEPEDDGGRDADGGHEGVRAAIGSGVDAAPIFELAKPDLDLVTLPIEGSIMGDRCLPVRF
jgi:hypothetical protein